MSNLTPSARSSNPRFVAIGLRSLGRGHGGSGRGTYKQSSCPDMCVVGSKTDACLVAIREATLHGALARSMRGRVPYCWRHPRCHRCGTEWRKQTRHTRPRRTSLCSPSSFTPHVLVTTEVQVQRKCNDGRSGRRERDKRTREARK